MRGFNRVVLMGNLTRDPNLRHVPSGMAVADIGLASSESYRNKEGERVEKTCFVDIVTWGRQAETCSQYLSKGAPVLVEGRLQYDQWETDEGQRRSKLLVRADRVQFLGRPKSGEKQEIQAEESGPSDEGGDEIPF
ncbi:MAG: single-stranded DNA-binding protein [Kiritimatiellia bacterium]|jgi:single-strand DNA-binding protein|nr:single-stranded DNA-binding protein [Kiritimatiellia bacterium]MDP6847693.1 single-stranded DNA-binding protein [Kiritimatiellia bacterium]